MAAAARGADSELSPDSGRTYFIVSEALTNAVKHSGASRLEVAAALDDGMLKLEVHDDGAGGATLSCGSGVIGLQDRVAALDGRFEVESPPGAGTRIVARLPLGAGPASARASCVAVAAIGKRLERVAQRGA